MDTLWAPWRMQYIRQNTTASGCFICRARDAADDRLNLVLKRTEHTLLMLNRYPYAPGHLMAIPLRHTGELDDLGDDEVQDLFHVMRTARHILRQAANPAGFNVGINLGKSAGAGAEDHLHVHIVPRWDGDTNFMPVIAGIRVIPEELSVTFDTFFSILNTGV